MSNPAVERLALESDLAHRIAKSIKNKERTLSGELDIEEMRHLIENVLRDSGDSIHQIAQLPRYASP